MKKGDRVRQKYNKITGTIVREVRNPKALGDWIVRFDYTFQNPIPVWESNLEPLEEEQHQERKDA